MRVVILFIGLLMMAPNATEQNTTYQCPPCGCRLDAFVLRKAGTCKACHMPLVNLDSQLSKKTNHVVSPLFHDGALGIFYPKLIYPLFVVSILICLSLLWKLLFHQKTLDPFLTLFILVIALFGFKNQIYGVDNGITNNPFFLYLPISFILALGPLIWLHVKMTTTRESRLSAKWLIHFIPAFLQWLGYLVLALGPYAWREALMVTPFETVFSHTEQVLAVAMGWIYWTLAWKEYSDWKYKIISNHHKTQHWLRHFLGVSAFLLGVWSLIMFINFTVYEGGITTLTYNPLWLAIFIVLFSIAIQVINDPRTFFRNGFHWVYQEPAWSIDGVNEKLNQVMLNEKPYLDPELSLNKLARQMDVNAKNLSAILNKGVGQNFYDYVNGYRIDEVKRLLLLEENRNLTIEAMANMAGFKSKSSFNAAFKKVTEMTPREYLKQAK